MKEIILTTGDESESIPINAGTWARMLKLIHVFGSETAVLENAVELLAKTQNFSPSPNYIIRGTSYEKQSS